MTDAPVLVLPRAAIPPDWRPRKGAVPLAWNELAHYLDRYRPAFWLPRPQAEIDRRWKQAIPYVLVSDPQNRLAAYRRRGGERRLHGYWSLGLGGHVERLDQRPKPSATLRACARRELLEELGVQPKRLRFLGVINEEQSHVGEVHWGLVFHARLDHRLEDSPELGLLHWIRPQALRLPLECWSRLALELLHPRKLATADNPISLAAQSSHHSEDEHP